MSALAAAQIIARDSRASIVVADARGKPEAVISAVDVLRALVPRYVLGDVSLAAVFDEKGADEVWDEVPIQTIGELIDDEESRVSSILEVEPDATLLDVAAQMAQERALVAVVKGPKSDPSKFVTLPALLDAVLHIGHRTDRPDLRA
jgi:CBS domain-containing protein